MRGRNHHVARILRETAQLLAVHGGPWKCSEPGHNWKMRQASYERAAYVIGSLMVPVEQIALDQKRLTGLPAIGKSMAEHVQEILTTGDLSLRAELLEAYPETILDLLEVRLLGPRRAGFLWRRYRAATLEDVEDLVRAGKLRGFVGIGEKSEANLLASIAAARKRIEDCRVLDFAAADGARETEQREAS
jgi:DNA polymerase (family X)